jgi:hypothetical protein
LLVDSVIQDQTGSRAVVGGKTFAHKLGRFEGR